MTIFVVELTSVFNNTLKHLVASLMICSCTLPSSFVRIDTLASCFSKHPIPSMSRKQSIQSTCAVDNATRRFSRCLATLADARFLARQQACSNRGDTYVSCNVLAKASALPSVGLLAPVHHPHRPPVDCRSIALLSGASVVGVLVSSSPFSEGAIHPPSPDIDNLVPQPLPAVCARLTADVEAVDEPVRLGSSRPSPAPVPLDRDMKAGNGRVGGDWAELDEGDGVDPGDFIESEGGLLNRSLSLSCQSAVV